MARYSVGFNKTVVASTFISQLRTPSTRDIRVWEVGIFISSAASLSVGLIRSNSVGTTFTTTFVPQADDTSSGAALTICDTAITTAPTQSASGVYLRRAVLPATIGGGIIWTFPTGLVVPISAGLLLWNISSTTPTVEGYWTFDE